MKKLMTRITAQILHQLHWWALAGLTLMLTLLFTISMLAPGQNREFEVSTDKIVVDRKPASEDLEKSLKLVINDPLLLADLEKVARFTWCVSDPNCRLQNGPWILYETLKGHRSYFENKQYKNYVGDLIELVLRQAEERKIDPKSPFFQDLKKVLDDYFQEQVDCWSCAGSSEFQRFYQLTGATSGALRIPGSQYNNGGDDDLDGAAVLDPEAPER